MTEPIDVSIVSVRLVADDTRKPTPPDMSANCYSVVAGALPIELLPHAPNRRHAVLTVCGLATDTALIFRKGDEGQGAPVGSTVQGGMVIRLKATSSLWLVAKSGVSIVVGVIAEYRERT